MNLLILMKNIGGTLYCKDNTTIKSEVKSKTSEYNPYG